jgi:signal transduction histidine kinase
MFRVYGCITGQHDLRLVVLAGIICLFAALTTIDLAGRVRQLRGWPRVLWLGVAAVIAGTGVWATHFVAMLAFRTGFPVSYDLALTAISVVIAIVLSGCGLLLAAVFSYRVVGGVVVGLAVAAMHFTGMAALNAPAARVWDMPYVYASLVFGVVGGALALFVGLRDDDLKSRFYGASLLALSICALHFIAMSALVLYPDPTAPFVGIEHSNYTLAVAVVAATVLIVTLGFAASAVDQHLMDRTLKEAERLRSYIAELEATKRALEQRTEQVKTALTEAAAGSQAKSQFLAAMSHELRTPLNAIIGFSEVQVAQMFGPIGDVRYLEYAKDIHRSGNHLLELINDVLDFSKLDAYGLHLDNEAVNLVTLLGESVHMLRGQGEKAGVSMQLTVGDNVPLLMGDARRLRQVMLNILSNALKFTTDGGSVNVTVDWSPEGHVIRVHDTGIGIAPGDIATALEPFGQVDNRLSRIYEGTGLGLPLAKRLVERHDGTLSLESAVRVGTTVAIRFPASRTIKDALSA